MQCAKCGAELLPSEPECARCAENTTPPAEPSISTSQTPDKSSPRPFAQITPYSGPYPPPYVQTSAYEVRPRPINLWAKRIGLVWSGSIPLLMLLNANNAKSERLESPDPITGGNLSLTAWIGIWALIAIPAFLAYLFTRRKPKQKRGF